MKISLFKILFSGLALVGAGGGYYYQQYIHNPVQPIYPGDGASIKPASASTISLSSPKIDAYSVLQESIKRLAHSKQFNDFKATDQLIQQHFRQLPLAQRYEIIDSFLKAVNQHISLVEGEKYELSRHDGLFLDALSEDYQDSAGVNTPQYPHQNFIRQLLPILPPLQKSWLSQAVNYDFEVLDIGEGLYSIRINPNYSAKRFAPALPVSDQIFIKTLAHQNQEQFYYDAGIAIDWQELGERAIFWENYSRDYSAAYFAKDAEALAAHYLYYFIHGMDNTPTVESFAEQENAIILSEEVKQAFQLIKAKYPASKVSQSIKRLETSMLKDLQVVKPVEPTHRSVLMGQL